jgi:hypothetical protein
MVTQLLTNPDAFFARRADSPGLRGPVVVVLLVALVGIAGSLPVLQATLAVLPQEASGFAPVFYAISAVGALVGTFVIWLIYAGAFHAISAVLYEGEGPFSRTLALTGWGFVPAILAGIVSAIVAVAVFQGMVLPDDPQQIQRFVRTLQRRPEFLVASVFGMLTLLWQGFLWAFAMKHGREITLREATVTVAIPVAVALALQVFNLGVF